MTGPVTTEIEIARRLVYMAGLVRAYLRGDEAPGGYPPVFGPDIIAGLSPACRDLVRYTIDRLDEIEAAPVPYRPLPRQPGGPAAAPSAGLSPAAPSTPAPVDLDPAARDRELQRRQAIARTFRNSKTSHFRDAPGRRPRIEGFE